MQSRRRFLRNAGILGGIAATFPASADTYIDLDLPGGPDRRELTTAFPQKAKMIIQRTRAPLLETPWDVSDRGVFTPNDQCKSLMAIRDTARSSLSIALLLMATRG